MLWQKQQKKATKAVTPAKKAAAKKAAKPAAPKKAAAKKAAGKTNAGLSAPVTPSAELASVIGSKPAPRTEIIKKIWDYIKANGLQDTTNEKDDQCRRKIKSGLWRQEPDLHV